MHRPIRVLIAKPGLDGHDRGAKVVAAALRDAGMEVIYTGLHQTPEMIATAAVQEDVDVVGLSILSGAHMTLFPRVRELLEEMGREDVLLTGGGIIPKEDIEALQRKGVGKLFGPGTPTTDLIDYIKEWFASRKEPPRANARVTSLLSRAGERHARRDASTPCGGSDKSRGASQEAHRARWIEALCDQGSFRETIARRVRHMGPSPVPASSACGDRPRPNVVVANDATVKGLVVPQTIRKILPRRRFAMPAAFRYLSGLLRGVNLPYRAFVSRHTAQPDLYYNSIMLRYLARSADRGGDGPCIAAALPPGSPRHSQVDTPRSGLGGTNLVKGHRRRGRRSLGARVPTPRSRVAHYRVLTTPLWREEFYISASACRARRFRLSHRSSQLACIAICTHDLLPSDHRVLHMHAVLRHRRRRSAR